MTDTHLHLSAEDYNDIDEFIKKSEAVGVTRFIVSCCDIESIKEAQGRFKNYDNVYLSLGIHPEYATKTTSEDLKTLESALEYKKVVALGEIGLDYHYSNDEETKKLQKDLFIKQLEIAKNKNLPVVIHTRDSIQDTYDILKKFDLKGVLHCYSGSYEMAKEFLKIGYYFGIGGVVTFKNSNLPKVVEKIPMERIVLETDSPYLSPTPYRGQKNGSWNIPIIVTRISEIKDIEYENVIEITNSNVDKLFDLKNKL